MKMKMCAVFLFYILAACFMGHCVSDDVQISPEKANSFTRTKTLSLFKRSIYQECYVEECVFEEVKEAFGLTRKACYYYHDYAETTYERCLEETLPGEKGGAKQEIDNKHAQKGGAKAKQEIDNKRAQKDGAKQGIARKRKLSK